MDGSQHEAVRVHVHQGEDRRVAAIVALASDATGSGPMPQLLSGLCRRVAEILPADVVSIYVREAEADGDWLVMRGNVGFPPGAVGNVRLRVGEGLTGFAAECMRVVSVATAPEASRYHHVDGIGEEKFPAFVAVPVIVGGRAQGVVVTQRRGSSPFVASEVALAAATTSAFALALSGRDAAPRRRAPGNRSTRLAGVGVVDGTALGTACALPGFGGLLELGSAAGRPGPRLRRVFDEVSGSLVRSLRSLRARSALAPHAAAAVETVLHDQRLLDLMLAQCDRLGAVAGLREVARSYALTPYRLGLAEDAGSNWMAERAREVEQLCLLVATRLTGARELDAGGVWLLPEPPGIFLALAARANGAVGMAVGAPVDPDHPATELLWRAEIPVVAEVGGLFDWVRDGDRVLVDGSSGAVRVEPPPGELVRLRFSEDGEDAED